jgi:hypothetical protein
MRCLYCGKELALLKRLTGGEFCSETHKQRYQDEYNRIAVDRLLQAQPKAALPKKTAQAQEDKPSKRATVIAEALEETVPVKAALEEEKMQVAEERVQVVAAAEPIVEEIEAPTEVAGPLPGEPPAAATLIESPLHAEPWQEVVGTPAAPALLLEGRAEFALPAGDVLPLPFRPDYSANEHPAREANVTPNEFVHAKATPPELAALVASNKLPFAGPLEVKFVPKTIEYSAMILDGISDFHAEVDFRDSELLDGYLTEIAFPSEDGDVQLISPAGGGEGLEPAVEDSAVEPESPRAALEALARMHQEATAAPVEAEPPRPVVEARVVVEAPEEPVADAPVEAVAQQSEETPKVEPAVKESKPSKIAGLIEILVKTFAPPKPTPVDGAKSQIHTSALLPRLTGMPLRPKIGLASPQSSQSLTAAQKKSAVVETKPKATSAGGSRTEETAKTESKTDKPVAAAAPIAPAVPASKPATPTPVTPAKAAPAPVAPTKVWQPPSKPQPVPVIKTTLVEVNSASTAPVAKQTGKPAEVASKTKTPDNIQKQTEGKKQKQPEDKKPVESPAVEVKAEVSKAQDIEAPTFGSGQPGSSFLGALKGKLAIAAVVVVMATGAYFMWGGKSNAPVSKSTAASADKAGPSIMVGGGGWVEGWAGDPSGGHFGRQITIYRPSLKLSDYRIDFQGQIDTKSMGWVFRASDPQNYYAMKLTMVAAGLSPKIALFKYLVQNGHQTQVGRVPVDLAVRLDTLYNVRVDVQGTRFTTYVQGQQVDTWNDDELKSGGVGFLNEREERGRVKSVSVSLLNGGKQ